jgi:ribosomal protein S1
MELAVEGRVLEFVKGGFRVQIQSYKAFCPMSQMDLGSIKTPEDYVNKKFEFLITQIDERHTISLCLDVNFSSSCALIARERYFQS